jgi:hypothetical protein
MLSIKNFRAQSTGLFILSLVSCVLSHSSPITHHPLPITLHSSPSSNSIQARFYFFCWEIFFAGEKIFGGLPDWMNELPKK